MEMNNREKIVLHEGIDLYIKKEYDNFVYWGKKLGEGNIIPFDMDLTNKDLLNEKIELMERYINQLKNHFDNLNYAIDLQKSLKEKGVFNIGFYRERLINEHKGWTKREDDLLLNYWKYKLYNVGKISKIMQRTPEAICRRIEKLELYPEKDAVIHKKTNQGVLCNNEMELKNIYFTYKDKDVTCKNCKQILRGL